VNKEHILKNEFHPFGGPIKDISWSPDNQRMVVVGEGRERYMGLFNFLCFYEFCIVFPQIYYTNFFL